MGRKKRNAKPRKQANRRRRRPTRRVEKSQGLGTAIATGVRNLISYLPGSSVIAPIADFALKAFGFTRVIVENNGVYTADTSICAVCTRFCVNYVNILVGSRNVVRDTILTNGSTRPRILSPWLEARLIEVSISIAPVNVASKRAGQWALGFKPFLSDIDHATEMKDTSSVGRIGMTGYPLYTTGPASKPLKVTYRPRVVDGHCYFFHPLDTPFGCVAIRYDAYNRDSFDGFTAEEMAMDCVVSGRLELRSRTSSDSIRPEQRYIDTLDTPLKDIHMFIENLSDGTIHAIERDCLREKSLGTSVLCNFVINRHDRSKLMTLEDMTIV